MLLGTSLALAVILAGCLGFSDAGGPAADCSGDWSPSIEANEPTIAPGENTTLHISAKNLTGVRFQVNSDLVWWMRFNDGTVSPRYDDSTDGYPPGYYWDECVNAEITIPVSIPQDADPGKHIYGVRVVRPDNPNGDSMTRDFSVTVSDN
jgi:hypothetical protein